MLLFCLSELNNNLYLDWCNWLGCLISCFHWRWLESKPTWFAFGMWFDPVLFLRFVSCILISQLGFFSMISGFCQLCLSISLVCIWEYYQFYLGSFSSVLYIPAVLHIFQLPSYWSWVHCVHFILILGPLCPSIFPILGLNVPICTSLSDSALQFRPWLAIMQCLIISF